MVTLGCGEGDDCASSAIRTMLRYDDGGRVEDSAKHSEARSRVAVGDNRWTPIFMIIKNIEYDFYPQQIGDEEESIPNTIQSVATDSQSCVSFLR